MPSTWCVCVCLFHHIHNQLWHFKNFKLCALNFAHCPLLNAAAIECVSCSICLFLHFLPFFPLFLPFGQSIAPLPFEHCSRLRWLHRLNHNLLSIGHLCIIDGSLAHSFTRSLVVPSTATMCSYMTGITTEQSFHYYCGNHCNAIDRCDLHDQIMPGALTLSVARFALHACFTLIHYPCPKFHLPMIQSSLSFIHSLFPSNHLLLSLYCH